MAYLGADQFVFEENWQGLDRLVAANRHSPTGYACVKVGIRFAIETQLGLGKVAAFFRSADHLMPQQEFMSMVPVKVADYIKLQLDERESSTREKAEKRRNLFIVLSELQNRTDLLDKVQRELAPTVRFAIASRIMVEKVNSRLVRAEAQGAPVIVVRELSLEKAGHNYRVMVDYGAARKNAIIVGGPKAIILDALRWHDGTTGRGTHEAAAVVVRMRQGFWDLARQVVRQPNERESALRQFDATQNLVRSIEVLASSFPDISLQFVSASALARDQARLARNQAKIKANPDNGVSARQGTQLQRRIASSKQALVLIDRLHALRSVLSADPRARSMHNSRLQLNARQASKTAVKAPQGLQRTRKNVPGVT